MAEANIAAPVAAVATKPAECAKATPLSPKPAARHAHQKPAPEVQGIADNHMFDPAQLRY